jgi:hypothetical protein
MGDKVNIIKPGDRVSIVPHYFLMEGRNDARTGVVFSQIDEGWFRIFISHEGSTDMIDCPRHVLAKMTDQ